MKKELQVLHKSVQKKVPQIQSIEALFEYKQEILGKKSPLQHILKKLKDLDENKRKDLGVLANDMKKDMTLLFEKRHRELEQIRLEQESWLDVTLPGKGKEIGHLHPISKIQYEVEDIFTSLGFMVLDGPHLESDFFNFEALNIPSHHPARDSQDTFYIKNHPHLLMRTQTSSVQVRAMLEYGAPIKAIVPGRVFRNEATDASHEHTFHQVEGLMVDKDVSIANLIAVMKTLLSAIFKKDVHVRLRPGYFPFVEPGFELDIHCLICEGRGCSVCKYTGWLELLPCGMIHPIVLEHGKVNPNEYSGFAFGLGLDRLVMMKYGIDDIRLFHSGNLDFLKQF